MTLVLQDADVQRLLPMEECINAMEVAFADYGRGDAVNIPRIRYRSAVADPDNTYSSNIHIGTTPSLNMAAVRIGGRPGRIGAAPQETTDPKLANRSWGFICLINMETGQTAALVHEFVLSGIRVGATSGLAAKYLARPDAQTVGIFGSGKLARTSLEALALVRPLRRVKVYSPTPAHRLAYAREMTSRLEIDVTAVDSPRDVVDGADIVYCATNAGYVTGEPVFDGAWLQQGQLVISIQNSDANFLKTEVDETTLARSSFVCINDRESVFSNAQRELLDPIERGVLGWDRIHELGAVVLGNARPANPERDIVYYKNNTGMGIQMSAAGAVLCQRARDQGIGTPIPDEWFGSDLSAWYGQGYAPSA